MAAIANLQYAWTLFVPEIERIHGWSRASIQTSFTIFVVLQTWLTPIEGIFLDKFGPKLLIVVGGLLCGLSWLIDSYANSLTGFYIGAIIGGIGAGRRPRRGDGSRTNREIGTPQDVYENPATA
jgi:MFS family permease